MEALVTGGPGRLVDRGRWGGSGAVSAAALAMAGRCAAGLPEPCGERRGPQQRSLGSPGAARFPRRRPVEGRAAVSEAAARLAAGRPALPGRGGHRGRVARSRREGDRPAAARAAAGRPGGGLRTVGHVRRPSGDVCSAVPDVRAWFSLETSMACGVGSCHGCVITLADGSMARVCHDGPVFAERACSAASAGDGLGGGST